MQSVPAERMVLWYLSYTSSMGASRSKVMPMGLFFSVCRLTSQSLPEFCLLLATRVSFALLQRAHNRNQCLPGD